MSLFDEPSEETDKSKRCYHLTESVLQLVFMCIKENSTLYAEAQVNNDPDIYRAYDYLRKNRKCLGIKTHTDSPLFVNEERVHLNGLVLLAEEEVDRVILAHYGSKFGCGTRVLHHHLNKIYNKISEGRIVKVTKASSVRGQMHPVFSNKGPKKIIQAKEVFERLQIDLVDLSRQPAFENGVEYRYALVVVDIFSRYLFLRPLTSKNSVEVCHQLEIIFREHGTPIIIQTDQGTEFQGFFDELCSQRNIRHIRSRAYHPESQGKIERLNRSWKNKMTYDILINGNTNWAGNLCSYSEMYNLSKHRALGNLTPFFVYFGREAVATTASNVVMTEDIEQTYVELDDEEYASSNILSTVIQAKETAKRKANEKIQNYYKKQKTIYEKDACAVSYNVGDEVMVKLTGKKYALSKRKNVVRPGIVLQAKSSDFIYLIKYEYNNRSREDWFSVDNITCRTVQEQEQRLVKDTEQISNKNYLHTQNKAKRIKTENSTVKNVVSMVDQASKNTGSKMTWSKKFHQNNLNYFESDRVLANSAKISTDDIKFRSDKTAFSSQEQKNEKKPASLGLHFSNERKKSKKIDNENYLIENVHNISKESRFEINYFYPETSDELQTRQEQELSKICISCDPAVPNNGGAVKDKNLTFLFYATCTLDYFLLFMRLAFLNNDYFRDFLESAARKQNMVAETLLKMEPSLYALDWNMARMIWAKMIGIVDRAIDEQHRSETVFSCLEVLLNNSSFFTYLCKSLHLIIIQNNMEQSLYEWLISQNRRIEEKLVQNVYINCFGPEDVFFANHLANLFQKYEHEAECNNINCPTKKKSKYRSYLTFNVIDGKIKDPIIAQYNTQYSEKCGIAIAKWSPNIPVPTHAELKYLNNLKIMDKENNDESGIYVICAGQRSFAVPTFLNVTYPPILLIENVEATITTANVPRLLYLQNQKYSLCGTTCHKSDHFIGMVMCNDHKQNTIVDDLFKITEGVHVVSRAFYFKSE